MKLNIFLIPSQEVVLLRFKLRARRMEVLREVEFDGWEGEFYFSKEPDPQEIPWAEHFHGYFDGELPTNTNHYAAFVLTKGGSCYALSFGKSHFYLRPHSDFDFGIELAKRIANEYDIRQTASKRFQGKRKKYIRSYAADSLLDIESGESVDYLQAAIIPASRGDFGKVGKFGTSAQLTVDISAAHLGSFLIKLEAERAKPACFKVPRTMIIKDEAEQERYDKLLVAELMAPASQSDFSHNSYDLYGIDFIFSNHGRFYLRSAGRPDGEFEELGTADLKAYIAQYYIPAGEVLSIRVVHEEEGRPKYSKSIKEALDFIVDRERVLLTNGRWVRFNQDYLEFLDEFLATVEVETPEDEFTTVSGGEPAFNRSPQVRDAGYELADTDFDIFKTRSSTPIEAWDLKKGSRVYAVKFGTPQKLGYVCDQATEVLELLRNRASVKQVPDFGEYCLWLGYKSKKPLESIMNSGSIILKQKIELWARRARELGIVPVLKISQKV